MLQPEVPRQADPTLVLALGPRAEGWVRQAWQLGAAYLPELLPLLQAGVVTQAGLRPLAPLTGELGPPLPLADGVQAALAAVLSLDAVNRVRAAGYTVGAGAPGAVLQAARLIVVFALDETGEALLPPLLQALEDTLAGQEQVLPPRVAGLGVLPAAPPPALPGWIGQTLDQLAASPRLESLGLGLVSTQLSTNLAITPENLQLVVPALLLAALAPLVPGSPWLFDRPADGEAGLWAPGLGLLAVPLPHVTAALGAALGGDLLDLLSQADQEVAPPDTRELAKAFSEDAAWRALYRDLTDDVRLDGDFQVGLQQGRILRELPDLPWQQWPSHLAEYDAQWGVWVAAAWLDRIRQAAAAEEQRLHQALTQRLDRAVARGEDVLPHLRQEVASLRQYLTDAWVSDRSQAVAPRDSDFAKLRSNLEQAILASPNPTALGLRWTLSTLCLAWLAGGAIRSTAASHPAVAWVAGGLALVATLALAFAALGRHNHARERVEQARQACLDGLQNKYAGLLRKEGLAALRRLKQSLVDRLQQLDQEQAQIQRRLVAAAGAARDAAAQFSPPKAPMVQPVVASWPELAPVAAATWQPTRLPGLLPNWLQRCRLTSYQALRSQPRRDAIEAPATSSTDLLANLADPLARRCAGAARDLLPQLVTGGQLRTISFYLRAQVPDDAALTAVLEQRLRELTEQARAALWPQVDAHGRLWEVSPGDDAAVASTPRPAPVGAPEALAAPGMLGVLEQRSVRR